MSTEIELKNTKLLKFIVDDRHRIYRHLVLLLVTFTVIFYYNLKYDYSRPFMYHRLVLSFGLLVTLCYVNIFLLVPLFFFNGKYWSYIAMLLLVVLACLGLLTTLFDPYLRIEAVEGHPTDGKDGSLYEGFIILIPIVLVTTMIKLFQRWIRDNKRINELKNTALSMELNELKNQINPHFLFNMLNGIKALIRSEPEKATQVIMKLSEFLRYQIYENNGEKTLLTSEITFISNFLNLEMLRRDNLTIQIISPEHPATFSGISIPPNLFTTFVENAVKHSIDMSGNGSFIRIEFSIFESQLCFLCTNSRDPEYQSSDQKNSGLGLQNIRRMLTLLYMDEHTLEVSAESNQFSVSLKLPL